jgi:predicted TIM-barrel fold metal-dependent hydrolase
MRTVALEEHFTIPSLVSRIPKELILARGFPPPEKQPSGMMRAHGKLQEQVYVTTSSQFTYPPLMARLATFGINHVLFSIDYPYSPNDRGRTFLDNMPLAPADMEKIAHENADILQLLKLQR